MGSNGLSETLISQLQCSIPPAAPAAVALGGTEGWGLDRCAMDRMQEGQEGPSGRGFSWGCVPCKEGLS
eukprot:1154556-Pelagomonas_calceolata.AAC.3